MIDVVWLCRLSYFIVNDVVQCRQSIQNTWWCPNATTWWRHQMEACSALLALCEWNSPVTDEFPSHMPVMRSFDAFFVWTNDWVNNRDADDLRRHRAHCSLTVMKVPIVCMSFSMYCVWLRSNQRPYLLRLPWIFPEAHWVPGNIQGNLTGMIWVVSTTHSWYIS